jgi:uracil-DNA glycosylase family 4
MPHDLRHYYLQQMGIEPWVLRQNHVATKNLTQLAADVAVCDRCPRHKTRTQTVFARGNMNAHLMIIDDYPGFDDAQQGLPFVGKEAGLFCKMMSSIGMSVDDVYMAYVLKCSPSEQREPTPEEINQCCGYLSQQISLVAPKMILVVGRIAEQLLLKETSFLSKERREIHNYQGTPVLVSYHPTHLLHHPADKKSAYNDMLVIKKVLNL